MPNWKQICVALGLLLLSAPTSAATQKLCGIATGTAGDRELTDAKGHTVLVLAQQGGEQRLADQADALIGKNKSGETGLQNGTRYCFVIKLDERGKPAAIFRAR
jgi:hypothetical protein